jgi:Na+-transporting NADH:ubiquinone oxidoreductase subunit NqrE
MPDDPDSRVDADADEPRGRSREVVVPLRLYKTVTVFSTLIAVAAVVLGFVALDAATQRATLEASEVNPWLAALGVAFIAAGGLVYAFASRFRAEGMRKDKDASDEDSDNG